MYIDASSRPESLAANQGIAILVDTVPDVVFERAVDIAGADGADRRQQSGQAHRGRGGEAGQTRMIEVKTVDAAIKGAELHYPQQGHNCGLR